MESLALRAKTKKKRCIASRCILPLNFKGLDYKLFAFAFFRKNCILVFLSLYPKANLEHLGNPKGIPVIAVCCKMSVF